MSHRYRAGLQMHTRTTRNLLPTDQNMAVTSAATVQAAGQTLKANQGLGGLVVPTQAGL